MDFVEDTEFVKPSACTLLNQQRLSSTEYTSLHLPACAVHPAFLLAVLHRNPSCGQYL